MSQLIPQEYLRSCSYFARSLLRLVLTAAIFFGITAPSVAGVVTGRIESKAPFESEEELQTNVEQGVVSSQRRFRLRPGSGMYWPTSDKAAHFHRPTPACVPHLVEGHCLSNGALAPLTC
jgi:hypothetical protein